LAIAALIGLGFLPNHENNSKNSMKGNKKNSKKDIKKDNRNNNKKNNTRNDSKNNNSSTLDNINTISNKPAKGVARILDKVTGMQVKSPHWKKPPPFRDIMLALYGWST
jgi:hypothetical protein